MVVMATSLHAAAMSGDVAVVRSLVASGADVEGPDEHGAKPLHWAACYEQVEVL